MSLTAGGLTTDSFVEGAVGVCPRETIQLGGMKVEAVIDSGSQVTLLRESFWRKHLESFGDLGEVSASWFRLTAANGLDIPILGYLVTDVEVREETLADKVVIIMKDDHWSMDTPCLLGMNILQHLSWWPSSFRRKPTNSTSPRYAARISRSSLIVPANSVHHITVTCGRELEDSEVLVEPTAQPPRIGLLVLPTMTRVKDGRLRVPIVNTTNEDLILTARSIVGTVSEAMEHHQVELQADVNSVGCSTVPPAGDATLRASNTGLAPKTKSGENSHRGSDKGWSNQHKADLSALQLNENLLPGDRAQLEALIHEYADVFAWTDGDLGYTDLVRHKIVVTDETPVAQAYRRIPPSALSEVRDHLDNLLHRGIIRPSSSPYAAPIVVVRKKSGEIRLCCDYRRLNDVTRRDSYPLPRIEECLDALGGAKFFTTLDLASGYHQVAMEEEDKAKTAFTCPFGLFEWNRMPFGLCNAPATFQRLMMQVMQQHIFQILLVYLDDLLIFAPTFDKHLEALRAVFDRLRDVGVKLNPSKCQLGQQEVAFLGHRISKDGIATDPDKITAVQNFKVPTTAKEVRSFVGFASYYRRFIKDFAKIARPLNGILAEVHKQYPKDRHHGERKELGDLWTRDCQMAFEDLRIALTRAPVLGYADYSKEFILEVDASNTGLGAVLSQVQDGRQRVIAYASRTLRVSEKTAENYSSFKLELMAKRWAMVEKFRGYLLGHKCIVYTDNGPLSHWKSAKLGAVEQRWAAEIDVFNHETRFRSGKTNVAADFLSRYPMSTPDGPEEVFVAVSGVQTSPPVSSSSPSIVLSCPVFCEPVVERTPNFPSPQPLPETVNPDTLQAEQEADADIATILPFVNSKTLPSTAQRKSWSPTAKSLLRQIRKLHIQDGVLMRHMKDSGLGATSVVVVPLSHQQKALQLAHDQSGHQGPDRTYNIIRARCYWPNLLDSVREHCRCCERCQVTKRQAVPIHQPPGHLVATQPLEVVAMDFLKLDQASDGKEDVLVMTDVFTKWTVAVATKDQTAQSVVKALISEWIVHYGVPLRLHSDQGRCFEAQVVQLLCAHYGIQKSRTTAYHPEGNGQTERYNRSLIAMLSALPPHERRRWPAHLREISFVYNSTPHATTGQSPYALLFGRDARLPIDVHFSGPYPTPTPATDLVQQHINRLNDVRQRARIRVADLHAKQDASATRHPEISVGVGDQVLLRLHHQGRSKLQPKFGETPFLVTQAPGDNGGYFVLRNSQTGEVRRDTGANLKKYYPPLVVAPPIKDHPVLAPPHIPDNPTPDDSEHSDTEEDEILYFREPIVDRQVVTNTQTNIPMRLPPVPAPRRSNRTPKPIDKLNI